MVLLNEKGEFFQICVILCLWPAVPGFPNMSNRAEGRNIAFVSPQSSCISHQIPRGREKSQHCWETSGNVESCTEKEKFTEFSLFFTHRIFPSRARRALPLQIHPRPSTMAISSSVRP